MPITPTASQNLNIRDPRVGDRIQFKNAVWQVTERSTYHNEKGYQCIEWTCESDSLEAYLLKETEGSLTHRWFFTLTIDADDVTLPFKDRIRAWIKENGKTQPTPDLQYRGQTYHYADTTEGTYANEDGDAVPKTTWDYWDAGHRNNLAVEIWPTGEVDCYLGYYIQAEDVTLSRRPNIGSEHPVFASDSLKGIEYIAFTAFVLLLEIGGAFDKILTGVIGAVILFVWLYPVMDAPRVAGLSIATAAALGWVFWHFPPLTHPIGLLCFFGAPAGLAWFVRQTSHSLTDKAARIHIAYALEIPLVVVGLMHYFEYAPAPHNLGQYGLALVPAVLGGLLTWGTTTFVYSLKDPAAGRTPSIDQLIR